MGSVAFLFYVSGRWTLSVDGRTSNFGRHEEALAASQEAVAERGGGTIFVGAGPGTKGPVEVKVEPTSRSVTSSAPASLKTLSEALREPPAAREAKTYPEIAAEISALRASYQSARATIEGFEDDVERDVGLGTLRLEAEYTLRQLRSSGPNLTEADLEPLTEYVASLRGGKATQVAVRSFEKASTRVLKDVVNSLLYFSLKGAVALIFGALAYYFGHSVEVGAKVAGGLVAGSSAAAYGIVRSLGQATPVAARAMGSTWEWAGQVGNAAEHAMAEPRRIEERVWKRCAAGAPWRHRSLARRARLAAQTIVGAGLLAFGIGVLGFLGGFFGFFQQL